MQNFIDKKGLMRLCTAISTVHTICQDMYVYFCDIGLSEKKRSDVCLDIGKISFYLLQIYSKKLSNEEIEKIDSDLRSLNLKSKSWLVYISLCFLILGDEIHFEKTRNGAKSELLDELKKFDKKLKIIYSYLSSREGKKKSIIADNIAYKFYEKWEELFK